jgi:hypothetical protein
MALKRTLALIFGVLTLGAAGFILSFAFSVLGAVQVRPLVEGMQNVEKPVEVLKKIDAGKRAELREREISAYASNPVDQVALQNLATLTDLEGSREKTQKIALALAALGRRSVDAQVTALQIEIPEGNFDSAFGRVDTLLRAHPELSSELFPVLVGYMDDERARLALARVLVSEPAWRGIFLQEVIAKDASSSVAYRIFSDIKKAKGTISNYEKRVLINKVYDARLYEKAYFIWLDLLPEDDLIRVKNVFDGTFDTSPQNMIFDWTHSPRKTSRVDVVARSGKSGDGILKLDLFSDRDGGAYVVQVLRLTPNGYTFTFDVQVDELKNNTGLVWRLSCLESGASLGESKPLLEKGPWETLQFDIVIPKDECATQYLRLENKSFAVLDQEVTGRLLFDNIKIDAR